LKELYDGFKDLIPATIMALFGVLAGYALREGDNWRLRLLFSNIIFGVFAGLMVYFGIRDVGNIPGGMQNVLIGMGGFLARDLLGLLTKFFMRRAKNQLGVDGAGKNGGRDDDQ